LLFILNKETLVGGDYLRKVYGTQRLIEYLHSVDYPMTEEEINHLLLRKAIPHLSPINNILIFNLDHIDWWIKENPKTT
jgi:hypothetical protein